MHIRVQTNIHGARAESNAFRQKSIRFHKNELQTFNLDPFGKLKS